MSLSRGYSIAAIAGTVLALSLVPIAGQVSGGDPRWVAPPDAARRTNPLSNRPDVEAGGRKLFHQRCASCHGDDGRGTEKRPDLTAAEVQAQSDGALFWKITSGDTRGGMPTFSFLPELQRWQLVLRLRGLRPSR